MTDIWRDLQHHLSNVLDGRQLKAALAMLVATLFGREWLPIHCAIVVLFCTDWILGLTVAMIQRRVSSSASLRGVLKGLVYATIILVAAQLGKVELIGPWLGGLLLALIAITESVSVLEKADTLSIMYRLDIPFLRTAIRFLQQRSGEIQNDLSQKG